MDGIGLRSEEATTRSYVYPQNTTHVADGTSDDIEVDVDIDDEGNMDIDLNSDDGRTSEHDYQEHISYDNTDQILAEDSAEIDRAEQLQTSAPAASVVPSSEVPGTGVEAGANEVPTSEDEEAIEIEVVTKSAEELENVSELCMALSACQLGTTLSLNNRTVYRAPHSSKTRNSQWLSEPLWPQLSAINEHNIQTGLYELASVNSPDARLCCVSGMGWELEGGTIELGRTGGIIFDSSCDNGVVNGVIFREGLLACYGVGCSVTFSNVEFDRCCVVALNGAQVKLEGCRFPLSVTRAEGIALFAHGSNTHVTMTDCSILGGVQGIACHAGAKIEASTLSVKRTQVTGVEVMGPNSSLELKESTFEDFSDEFSDKLSVVGALVHSDGKAYVRNMCVKNVAFGVAVLTAGHADIVDSMICETQWNCVSFGRGSTGSVTSCTMSGSHKASGLHVSGEGTKVKCTDSKCLISRNAGFFVLNQAALRLEKCETGSNKVAGFKVKKEATLALVSCVSDGDRIGCHVTEKGQLSGRDATIKNSVGTGMSIHDGGSASLLGCSIADSSESGVDIRGSGSEAIVIDCTISGAQNAGVVFMQGARGQIKATTISNAKELHGILCDGKGTTVEMQDCKLLHNGVSGALIADGAAVKMQQCMSNGNQSSGFCVQKKADLDLLECSSDGDKQGMKAYKGGRVHATKVNITGSMERGAYVSEGGIGEFKDCKIIQAGTSGVEVKYVKSMLTMVDCVVDSSEGSCIVASHSGKAQVHDCELLKAKAQGLDVTGHGSEIIAQRCRISHNEQGGVIARDDGLATLTSCESLSNKVAGYTVKENGVLNLLECTSLHDKVGCKSMTEGWLSGKDVTVQESDGNGLRVWDAGSGEFTGCKFVQCQAHGIELKDLNSKLYMKDSEVLEPKLGCVFANKGSQGTIHGCKFSGAKAGHGVEVAGKGTMMELSGCSMKKNSKAGVHVSDKGSMSLVDCIAQGHSLAGFEVQGKGSTLRLDRSTSDADKVGCHASKEGKVFANQATLTSNPVCGLLIANAGKSDMQGCSIDSCGANGVEVKNIRSFLKMEKCTVTGSGRACILVSEMAKGELNGCVFSGAQKLHGAEIVGDGTEITMIGYLSRTAKSELMLEIHL